MNARIVEFGAGVAAMLIAIAIYVSNIIPDLQNHPQDGAVQISIDFLVISVPMLAPGVCIGLGSYIHGMKKKSWGFWLLFIGAIVNDVLIAGFFLLIVLAFPAWTIVLFIIEFFFVVVAAVAALWIRRDQHALGLDSP
jgi:hypothetical protein